MTLDEIVRWMEANNVSFFHFTDARNMASIRDHGLLSMRELRVREIIPVTGGNDHSLEADAHFGMDNFVHLCFRKNHPMVYKAQKYENRLLDLRWLKVSAAVLNDDGVLMCDQVSNKSGVTPLPPKEIINSLDWEILYGGIRWDTPEKLERVRVAEKYEVLVPVEVARKHLRNLNG